MKIPVFHYRYRTSASETSDNGQYYSGCADLCIVASDVVLAGRRNEKRMMKIMNKKSQNLVAVTVQIAGVGLGLMTGVPSAIAALTLPTLPAGCQIIRNELHPVQNTVRVEPGTPAYGVIGPQQTSLLQVEMRCDGLLKTPMTLRLSKTGSPDWKGAGRDVIPTGVKDVGLRLYAQGEASGGNCSPAGWLGAGTGEWKCTLPAGTEGDKMLSMQVAVQMVKTGDNTPLQSTEALLPVKGSDVQLSVDGTPVPLLSSGVVAPILVTPVSCTIERGANDTINFGTLKRKLPVTSDYSGAGDVLGYQQADIAVKCTPVPTGGDRYHASVTFNGSTSKDYVHWGQNSALTTGISDIFIVGLPELAPPNDRALKFGTSVPLLDEVPGKFSRTILWTVNSFSKTGKVPDEYGAFISVATYTVDVE
ncbi:hypothetical protein QNC13_003139 [Salmonella enterica]|nr:hypothetical protein [Salmonella enterica subsp. enterica serovar Bareilly]ELV8154995.1 hypothetical protein [Salmonella enterica]ELV8306027.1 hypothetical protein [Salmonella enterica]